MKCVVRLVAFVSLLLGSLAQAATFGISPSVISNDYSGVLTVQAAVTTGETVQLVQHIDLNGNGAIDPEDIAVRSETITDGNARLLGGATNINLVADSGATNGAILANIQFSFSPYFARGVGKYIFELIKSNGTKASAVLTVLNGAYGQTVSGNVVSSGTNVPYAFVAVMQIGGPGHPRFILGGNADASGHFSLACPTGTYNILAVHSGYIANLTNFPVVTMSAGANTNVTVTLETAPRTITGSVQDSASTTLHPIPCAEISVLGTNGDLSIGVCDTNGNFTASANASVSEVELMTPSAQAAGYLVANASDFSFYDASTGDITNALIVTKAGSTLVYGRVRDSLGNPIANIDLNANADFGQYNGFGTSDANGNYALALDAGYGQVSLMYPELNNNYLWETPVFGINDGQAMNLDVVGHPATARVRVHLVNENGDAIPNVYAVLSSYTNFGIYTVGQSDTNGWMDLPSYSGQWYLNVYDSVPGYLFQEGGTFNVVDGVNVTNTLVARATTTTISGYVTDVASNGIANVPLYVTNHVGSTNYSVQIYTDNSGYYSVDVFPGTWNVWCSFESMYGAGYQPVPTTNVTVPPAALQVNFVGAPVPPPSILTTNLFNATVGQYYFTSIEVTNGSYPMTFSIATGALPGGVEMDEYGYISGTPTNSGTFNFSVQVVDARGSNDVKALSLQVQPQAAGPLSIVSTYMNDAAQGCFYSNTLVASGGVAPYSWQIVSGTLPQGLSLNANGVITGTPVTNEYSNFSVRCTDSANTEVVGYISLSANPPLTMSVVTLTPASVGTTYYGGLYAYGGMLQQSWSIISGTLPAGLTFDTVNGTITGTPATIGTYPLTIRVTDGCATIDTVTVLTNVAPLQITTSQLPNGQVNQAYSAQVQATGGVPPYSFYTGSTLPYGLIMNSDGTVSGTPSYTSTNVLTIYAYDGAGGYTQTNVTLAIIDQPNPPTVDSAQADASGFTFRVNGTAGQDYTLEATADLTNWSGIFTTNAPSSVFFVTDTNKVAGKKFYRLRAGQ
jgi:hypothetical protein